MRAVIVGEGGFVGTRIPINHHAGGPTFTDCRAPADEEGFVVPSAMVQPLAVSTGLEFQGLEHYAVAATRNEEGCVEFRLGTWVYSDVQYPR